MRLASRFPVVAVTLALALSCIDSRSTSPNPTLTTKVRAAVPTAAVTLPSIRISEFHYDNASTDVGEAIEVSGPAGASLVGWSIVRYNGNSASRAVYTSPAATNALPATIPATCGARGVAVLTYAANGLQNGGSSSTGTTDPDGFALVDNNGQVVEFLSYEGSFTAADGPAAGMTSVDVGVRELGTEAVDPTTGVTSLKRDGAGVWSGPSANSFGVCNDNDEQPPAPVVASVTVTPTTAAITVGATQQFSATAFDAGNQPIAGTTFNWASSDPLTVIVDGNGLATALKEGGVTITATAPNSVSGSASLQVNAAAQLPSVRFSEIHYDNSGTDANEAIEIEGPGGTDVSGWSVVLYDGTNANSYSTTTLSGTIAPRDNCGGRGVVVVNYATNGIQNGAPDGMALVNASGDVIEFLSYEGAFTAADGPAAGKSSTDIGVSESSSTTSAQSLQRASDGAWSGPSAASFGRCNIEGPAPAPNGITFTGRLPTDPALPVGFEDQLFATERDGTSNAIIITTFTWTSETPDIASIDANGVMHALASGSATFRATAADGASATYTLPTTVATASTTAQYANNTEFGDPTDADPSDDFIVRRPQYTLSYNKTRNTPNWVAYDLEQTHFGTEVDRCDCFTHDPSLPADYIHLTTADYTGAGSFAGYGIDRGHLARSFDRTAGTLDNALTYYLSNIIPQASDLNQGPWAAMENYLGDLARDQNKEVYIVAGVAGNKGSVKGEGKITIPQQVWKVALVMPRDRGLADVTTLSDVEAIAVIMPNDPGVRNVDWTTYKTTVDAIESLSGYDLLSLLPDQIEIALESNTQAPVARVDGPYASNEGSPVSMSAAASTDADGDALTYAWDFGDGMSGAGASVAHSYAQNGTYTVQLTATDPLGLYSVATTVATVANVAPAIAPFSDATLLPGETYSASGSFTDPGSDSWTAAVNYGDGSGTIALGLSGKTFALSHTYASSGTFTVSVQVSDDQATSAQTQTVTVLTPAQGVQNIIDDVQGNTALVATLEAAVRQLQSGNKTSAANQLTAFENQVDALVRSGRMSTSEAAALRAEADRVIRSLGS